MSTKQSPAEQVESQWLACVLAKPKLLTKHALPLNAFQSQVNFDVYSAIWHLHKAGSHVEDLSLIIAWLIQQGHDDRQATQMVCRLMRTNRDLAQFAEYTTELNCRLADRNVVALNERIEKQTGGELVRLDAAAVPFRQVAWTELLEADQPTEWLLPGMLARHAPGVILGPGKSLKTSLAVDLCGALASGGKFLGQYQATRSFRVGLVSGVDDRQALLDLTRRWSAAAQTDPQRLADNWIWALSLADLADPANREQLSSWIRQHRLEVVLIEPEELLPPLTPRKRLQLLQQIIQACRQAGATPILCCPTRKSLPAREMTFADLEAAGCQPLARQWLLVNRRAAYEPGSGQHQLWLTFGGDAGHEGVIGVDIDEGRLTDPGGKRWQVALRSADQLRREAERRQAEQVLQTRCAKIRRALGDLPPSEASKSQVRARAGMNSPRFAAAWDQLVAAGEIAPVPDSAAQFQSSVPRFRLISPPPAKNNLPRVPKIPSASPASASSRQARPHRKIRSRVSAKRSNRNRRK
ncbi:AAA family ATPase [Blastopirellula marina]|nr:AAA family ATPase [Blastopirellula marina]